MHDNMIERAFEEALLHKGNKRNTLRQFAIAQARHILQAAGVVDPVTHDQAAATRLQRVAEQPFFEIPEDLGFRFTREIGGKSVEQMEAETKAVGGISRYALDIMHSPKFTTLEEVTLQELIKLRVQDLGLRGTPTTKQVIEKATHSRIGNMALELCRAEVGPHQRIADTNQPMNTWYYIAMEQIVDRSGRPGLFSLGRREDGVWLDGVWASPGYRWGSGDEVVFALRKVEPVKA